MQTVIGKDPNATVVDIRFISIYRKDEYERQTASPKGLRDTLCTISEVDLSKTGKEKYSQIAQGRACLSHKDVFNKHVGRKLALTRALNQLSKHERRQIWNAYKNSVPESVWKVPIEDNPTTKSPSVTVFDVGENASFKDTNRTELLNTFNK